uniref:Uncharacterized protein n=1 Tax=Triticum urartu TaxID=4572 RepID=A0A8R7PR53_TRIUA
PPPPSARPRTHLHPARRRPDPTATLRAAGPILLLPGTSATIPLLLVCLPSPPPAPNLPSCKPPPATFLRWSVQLLQPTQVVTPFATTAGAQIPVWPSSTSSFTRPPRKPCSCMLTPKIIHYTHDTFTGTRVLLPGSMTSTTKGLSLPWLLAFPSPCRPGRALGQPLRLSTSFPVQRSYPVAG